MLVLEVVVVVVAVGVAAAAAAAVLVAEVGPNNKRAQLYIYCVGVTRRQSSGQKGFTALQRFAKQSIPTKIRTDTHEDRCRQGDSNTPHPPAPLISLGMRVRRAVGEGGDEGGGMRGG